MSKKDFILMYVFIIIINLAVFIVLNIKINKINDRIEYKSCDNIKIDSLVNEINHKDSIVIKLNKDMKDEINKSYELNDTASLMLFYKLCKG